MCRFVNSYCDMEQKGVVARSIASIAQELGIPTELIDIRHDVAHMLLPSVATLKLACQRALAWIKASYWDPQVDMNYL